MKTWQRLGQILTQKTTEGLLPVDLADAMWLAAYWGQFELAAEPVVEKPSPTTPKPESEPAPTAPNSEPEAVQEPIPEVPSLSEPELESYDEQHVDMQLPSDSAENRPRITCPAPPALTHKNKLAKAIRPFHQHQPSRFRTVIDELATVEFIAEQNCWEPVLGWESERRFEVALVVEKSVAMGFWHNVVTELKQLLTRKRMFRDVRVWSLRKGNSGLEILPGLNQTVGGWRSPSVLVEPTGRRLILLVSDCVSKGWYDGSVAQQISKWSRYMPVALLQMLPEKLWQRTGLGAALPIQVLPRSVGIRSIPFKAETSFMFDEEQLDDGALLPIAIIEPWPLEQLAGLIAGVNVQGAPGFYLPNKPEVGGEFEDGGEKESRLDRFWRTASPDARRLALLLAAAPRIRLPIVRLVRAAMLKDATHVHEAEFLLSGLLEVTHEPDGGVYPDRVDYDFVDGVREELLDSLSVIDARKVLEKVSLFVEEHLGEASGFAAVLANPTGEIDSVEIGELSESFATISATVLKRLGGRFKKVVEKVELDKVDSKEFLKVSPQKLVKEYLSNPNKMRLDWYKENQNEDKSHKNPTVEKIREHFTTWFYDNANLLKEKICKGWNFESKNENLATEDLILEIQEYLKNDASFSKDFSVATASILVVDNYLATLCSTPEKFIYREIEKATIKIFTTTGFKGSGFFITPDGYLLSAFHCVQYVAVFDEDVFIETYLGEKFEAKLDEDKSLKDQDIAVLKIEHYTSHYLPLGIISAQHLGDKIVSMAYTIENEHNIQQIGIYHGTILKNFYSDGKLEVIGAFTGQGESGGPVYHYNTKRVIGLISEKYKSDVAINTGLARQFASLFDKWPELEKINNEVTKSWDERLGQFHPDPEQEKTTKEVNTASKKNTLQEQLNDIVEKDNEIDAIFVVDKNGKISLKDNEIDAIVVVDKNGKISLKDTQRNNSKSNLLNNDTQRNWEQLRKISKKDVYKKIK